MANSLYPSFKQGLLDKLYDLNTDTVKVALVDDAYSYSSGHNFWDDVVGNVIGTPQTLGSPTITNGVFDAADPTFTAVPGGDTVGGYVLFIDTGGGNDTDPLIAFFDTDSGGAISIATNGSDIEIAFNPSGIFAL